MPTLTPEKEQILAARIDGSQGKQARIQEQRRLATQRYRAKYPEKEFGYRRAYYLQNKARYVEVGRMYHTGWSQEEFDIALAEQNGRCAICGEPPGKKGLAADHCHKTGKKRQLLCTGCNTWIGGYEKDLDKTEKRIAYIKLHQSKSNDA